MRGDLATAARSVAAAKRLRRLPLTPAVAADGSMSGGQVTVVLGNVDERRASLSATHEVAMVPEPVGARPPPELLAA